MRAAPGLPRPAFDLEQVEHRIRQRRLRAKVVEGGHHGARDPTPDPESRSGIPEQPAGATACEIEPAPTHPSGNGTGSGDERGPLLSDRARVVGPQQIRLEEHPSIESEWGEALGQALCKFSGWRTRECNDGGRSVAGRRTVGRCCEPRRGGELVDRAIDSSGGRVAASGAPEGETSS